MNMNDNIVLKRWPAEWERTGAVLVAWPHIDTDWAFMLNEVNACYVRIVEALTQHVTVIVVTPDHVPLMPLVLMSEIVPEKLQWFTCPTNDTWTRDYGPIVTTTGADDWQINDFAFNGWGLKFAADLDNLVTSKLWRDGALMGEYVNRLGFILEGGSIESDGKGTLMTTSRCLLSPNRNGDLDRGEIETRLAEALGAERVLWVDYGALKGDDTDSHIDTLARFAPDDTIVYVGCDDPDDMHFEELERMRVQLESFRTVEGNPYRLVRLPLPDAIIDDEGQRLPATYANFLIVNNTVFMPTYRQLHNDRDALAALHDAFPGFEIVQIDCTELIYQHGSLHCATMQLPFEILPLCPTPFESE